MTQRSSREPSPRSSTGKDEGMTVLSLLLAGIGLYGGVGWLVDRFADTVCFMPIGILLGVVVSVYMVIKRYGGVQ